MKMFPMDHIRDVWRRGPVLWQEAISVVQARRPCDGNIRDVPRKLETSVAGRGSGKEVVRDEVRAKGGLRATERMLAFALREIAAIAGFWAEGHDVVYFKGAVILPHMLKDCRERETS